MRSGRLLIQFFHPWNTYYLGVQIGNYTGLLFRVRHINCDAYPDSPLQWRWAKYRSNEL